MIANEIRVNLSLENERNEHDRGPWLPRTSYSVGDRVQEGGLDYICVSGYHYSAATFAEDMAEHWVDRELLYAVSGAGGGSSTIALLSEIGNVPTPTAANDGQAVTWNDATQQYVFVAPGALLRLSEVGNVPTPTIANDQQSLVWDDATQAYVFVAPSGGARLYDALTVAADGQTVFTLSQTPTNAAELQLSFRNVLRNNGLDFTVSGTTITFTMPGVETFSGDQVQIWYE